VIIKCTCGYGEGPGQVWPDELDPAVWKKVARAIADVHNDEFSPRLRSRSFAYLTQTKRLPRVWRGLCPGCARVGVEVMRGTMIRKQVLHPEPRDKEGIRALIAAVVMSERAHSPT